MSLHTLMRTSLLLLLGLGGCSPTPPPGVSENEGDLKRQMDLARSLEAGFDYRRATHMYELIAQSHPRSGATIDATRKAAILNASVRNPSRNDSAALQWFRKYLALPVPAAERENAEICISLLDRILTNGRHALRHAVRADSLEGVVERQAAILASQARRIQELERDVYAANAELKRLKDVDVRLSQTRRRR